MGKFRPRLTAEEWDLVKRHRSDRDSGGEDLDEFFKNNNISENDVQSIKFWQTSKGENRFSVVTRSKDEIDFNEILDDLVADLEAIAPRMAPPPRKTAPHTNCLVFAPSDIHIGKLSSDYETRDGYNSGIAVQRVQEATENIISMAKPFGIEKVVLIAGNDILHVDNNKSTTTAGTPQDTDGMWHEAFIIAERMYVSMIQSLCIVADVHVVFAPSNHDYVTGFMLMRVLQAFFSNSQHVTFDIAPSHRKYFLYGDSLIGVSHGDGAKEINLPILMAQEAPKMWSKSDFRYWYLGHIHHKVSTTYKHSKDYPGVTVEYMRSPSGADSWHAKKGYVGSPKAIEAFIHAREGGQVARFSHLFK